MITKFFYSLVGCVVKRYRLSSPWHLLIVLCFGLLFSCSSPKTKEEAKQQSRHRTYKGTLNITADEGLKPILSQELEIFNFLYDSVITHIDYKTEREMWQDFKAKKSTIVILPRKLSSIEINIFKTQDTLYVREQPVAYDAVALIGAKDFDDSHLDIDLLKKCFSEKANNSSCPKLVFENQNASTVLFVANLLGYRQPASANVYALQTTTALIDYIEKNNNAIGFVPYNLISDRESRSAKNILERVKILSLRTKTEKGEEVSSNANQSDIATGIYPLIRTINTVTRFTNEDNLELLLVSFLSKSKGAKIFLKAGLIPARMPEREIIVKESEATAEK